MPGTTLAVRTMRAPSPGPTSLSDTGTGTLVPAFTSCHDQEYTISWACDAAARPATARTARDARVFILGLLTKLGHSGPRGAERPRATGTLCAPRAPGAVAGPSITGRGRDTSGLWVQPGTDLRRNAQRKSLSAGRGQD